MASSKIALIFDFDDTLTDDSTSALLSSLGVDIKAFWKEANRLVTDELWDPTLAYLHLILRNIEQGKIPALTNARLRAFGKTLKPYPGLKDFLKDLRSIASKQFCEIEFYIVSGGIQDILDGFQLRSEFSAAWGCQLAAETPEGPVKFVKRAISFTEKTRYLFEINKGLDTNLVARNPYLVNDNVPAEKRRVPFKNMIYIGDGLTDVPCFSLVQKKPGDDDRGLAFGVFKPEQEESAKKAWVKLLAPARVTSLHAPRYRKKDDLGALLRTVVATLCVDIRTASATAIGH
jgi:phosphoserine phosphatase